MRPPMCATVKPRREQSQFAKPRMAPLEACPPPWFLVCPRCSLLSELGTKHVNRHDANKPRQITLNMKVGINVVQTLSINGTLTACMVYFIFGHTEPMIV